MMARSTVLYEKSLVERVKTRRFASYLLLFLFAFLSPFRLSSCELNNRLADVNPSRLISDYPEGNPLVLAAFVKYLSLTWLRNNTAIAAEQLNSTLKWQEETNNLEAGLLNFLRLINSKNEGNIFSTRFHIKESDSTNNNSCALLFNKNSSNQNRTKSDENDAENEISKTLCQMASQDRCLSIEKLISLYKNIPSTIGSNVNLGNALEKLCPLLLFQSHDPQCKINGTLLKHKSSPDQNIILEKIEKIEENLSGHSKIRTKPTPTAVWGFGILFVTVVSCCSLVGVALLPLLNKSIYQAVLVLFEGLAVGSLASSALFHLIPQAFGLLGQDSEHKYLWKALIIFGGIYLFFLSERGMKIIIQKRQRKKFKRNNPEIASLTLSPSDLSNHELIGSRKALVANGSATSNHIEENSEIKDTEACLSLPVHSHSHVGGAAASFHHNNNNNSKKSEGGKQVIATVAWMIIFGDGLHNFIDGLSMGAAFSESILSGVSISVAVICEEFPHELGDFAVLLSAGMTLKQALMYNFLSALTCYLGLVFGILLGDLAEGGPYIFALAGGMFLYISLVDMVGELSEALEEASQRGTKEMLKIFALQNIGIIVGVAVLFLMARYSEKINFQSISNLGESFKSHGADFFRDNSEALMGAFGDA